MKSYRNLTIRTDGQQGVMNDKKNKKNGSNMDFWKKYFFVVHRIMLGHLKCFHFFLFHLLLVTLLRTRIRLVKWKKKDGTTTKAILIGIDWCLCHCALYALFVRNVEQKIWKNERCVVNWAHSSRHRYTKRTWIKSEASAFGCNNGLDRSVQPDYAIQKQFKMSFMPFFHTAKTCKL